MKTCTKCNITDDIIIRLNYYTNLQPLCSRKNLEKGNEVFIRE